MHRQRLSLVSVFLISLAFVSTIWGQSVYWSPAGGTLQEGKANSLDLFFDACEPAGQPTLPDIEGLELSYRGSSNSRTIINGQLSAKTILNYQAIPTRRGSIAIPSFTVESSVGTLTVPAVQFEVVEATVGNTGMRPGDVFLSRFQIRDETIYAGEVFVLDYYAGAKQEYQLADLSDPVWNPQNLITAGLKETQSGGLEWEGSRYMAKAYQAKAVATEPGFLQLPGAKQDATVVVGRRRDFLFQEPIYDSFAIESEPVTLEIVPLPGGAPASFSGAVGDFTLESRVVPAEVQVGEPITWTLELSGEGNWPEGIGVPSRAVAKSFRAIQPEVRNEFEEDALFTGRQTEDIVLIPTEAGTYEFGPVNYSYFDPASEEYKTVSIPAMTVEVAPAASAPSPAPPTASPADTNPSDASPAATAAALRPAGQNAANRAPQLPRAPLESMTELLPPVAHVTLWRPLLIALAVPLALWFALAFGRSYRQDPKRPNRQALKRLKQIAREPLPASQADRLAQQWSWRRAAAAYLGIASKEPSPNEVERHAEALCGREQAAQWRRAWELSDQVVFSAQRNGAEPWRALQSELASNAPRPSFTLSHLLSPRSWWGAVALAALATALWPQPVMAQGLTPPADEAATFYEAGDFKQAEAAWIKAINQQPEVFENRYNAGLAAAQQGDWSRAWAFWTGAFCLEPRHPDLLWNLRLAHTHTAAYDPVLQALLDDEGLYRIARLLSPGEWQSLALASLWAASGVLVLAVASLYLPRLRRISFLCLVLGIALGLFAYFSKWAGDKYEALAHPESLLVIERTGLRSIPSDLSDEQITSEIREGTIAQSVKRFLGWTKVALPNGESGWMRAEDAIPLYGPIFPSNK